MTFNLIGLGLSKDSITAEAMKVLKKCEKIYVEDYTVNFPYSFEELKDSLEVGKRLLSMAYMQNDERDYVGSEATAIEALEHPANVLILNLDAIHSTRLEGKIKDEISILIFLKSSNTDVMESILKNSFSLEKQEDNFLLYKRVKHE